MIMFIGFNSLKMVELGTGGLTNDSSLHKQVSRRILSTHTIVQLIL